MTPLCVSSIFAPGTTPLVRRRHAPSAVGLLSRSTRARAFSGGDHLSSGARRHHTRVSLRCAVLHAAPSRRRAAAAAASADGPFRADLQTSHQSTEPPDLRQRLSFAALLCGLGAAAAAAANNRLVRARSVPTASTAAPQPDIRTLTRTQVLDAQGAALWGALTSVLDVHVLAAALLAVAKLCLTCALVGHLLREGRLPPALPGVLSQLAYELLLPAFLLSRLATTLAAAPAGSGLWLLPALATLQIVSGAVLGCGLWALASGGAQRALQQLRRGKQPDAAAPSPWDPRQRPAPAGAALAEAVAAAAGVSSATAAIAAAAAFPAAQARVPARPPRYSAITVDPSIHRARRQHRRARARRALLYWAARLATA